MPNAQTGAKGAVEGAIAQDDLNNKQDQGSDSSGMSNADVKSNPLFLKLASELAELKKAEAARLASLEDERRKQEIENAKKTGEFDKALSAAEQRIAAAEAKALEAELSAILLGKGARNSKGFFKAALAEYDSKTATIEEYAESLKTSDVYKDFFLPLDNGRQPIPAPGKTPVNQGAVWTEDFKSQVKAWETGDDPEKRKEARKLISEYRKQHGVYPYKT